MRCVRSSSSFNVFSSREGGDFRLLEADVPARDEDIDSRVDVPVMSSTTAATDPVSCYEVLSTLWAAACVARGTDLRGESLVNLDVFSPVPHGDADAPVLPYEVPNAVHRPRLTQEIPTRGRISDPLAAGQHHRNMVSGTCCKGKPDAEFTLGIFTFDLPSAATQIAQTHGMTRSGRDPAGLFRVRPTASRSMHRSAMAKTSPAQMRDLLHGERR